MFSARYKNYHADKFFLLCMRLSKKLLFRIALCCYIKLFNVY
ncbi:hypothetical protein SEENIN0B_01504 [Salmonella enterica subsp. enterica serovar Infantis str. SARB27]|uniref:Uncharacterized protein n=1 Tax=Salmonella enterica subsp. enterica serovar Infantis str. SARB27 TaxID=596155 RepID=A0A6C8G7T3_SALIN|nr:hypothetical protein SEENIN0B_01504 [Salmonella enterica subsp. enterica serovar Infantis str. SARB27]